MVCSCLNCELMILFSGEAQQQEDSSELSSNFRNLSPVERGSIVVLIHEGGKAARQQYVFIDSRACRERRTPAHAPIRIALHNKL